MFQYVFGTGRVRADPELIDANSLIIDSHLGVEIGTSQEEAYNGRLRPLFDLMGVPPYRLWFAVHFKH